MALHTAAVTPSLGRIVSSLDGTSSSHSSITEGKCYIEMFALQEYLRHQFVETGVDESSSVLALTSKARHQKGAITTR